jgi:hypothetical protein
VEALDQDDSRDDEERQRIKSQETEMIWNRADGLWTATRKS